MEKQGHPIDEFATRKEVAKTFRSSVATITEWCRDGLPAYKIGGKFWVRWDEVAEFIRTKLKAVPMQLTDAEKDARKRKRLISRDKQTIAICRADEK